MPYEVKGYNIKAQCPYFLAVSPNNLFVKCEGCFGDKQILYFEKRDMFKYTFNRYCADKYKQCPYYRAIELYKYSE